MRNRLAYAGSLALAALLLYLALRDMDTDAVAHALRAANYGWIPVLTAVTLLAGLARAWRWRLLMEALPECAAAPPEPAGKGPGEPGLPGIKPVFYSVMIGYMVNFAAPRLGEVARTANLAAQSRLRFSSVLGTVVTERLLDAATLGVGLGSVFLLLTGHTAILRDILIDPLVGRLNTVSFYVMISVAVGAAGAALLLYLFFLKTPGKNEAAPGSPPLKTRLAKTIAAFRDGMGAILHAPKKQRIAWGTAMMWFLYLLMAYIPFRMLNMTDAYALSLADGWIVMIFGALGVLVPLPGGTGSYHYITIQALVHLFAVNHEAAAAYAVLCHTAQLVLHVAAGGACLVLQGARWPRLRAPGPGDSSPGDSSPGAPDDRATTRRQEPKETSRHATNP